MNEDTEKYILDAIDDFKGVVSNTPDDKVAMCKTEDVIKLLRQILELR